jgi:hypothetical protein
MYAMMHIAIHDALNAIDRRSRPYALNTHVRGASPDAAVAAAARGVLVPLLQQLPPPFSDCVTGKKVVEGVEAEYAAAIDAIPHGLAKTRGLAVRRAAAAAILRARKADGSDTLLFDKAYPQGTRPGEYRFTPGSDFAFAPGWSDVTPFVLNSSSQFRPGPPYAVTSKQYAKDFDEVKRLGGDGVTTPSARTADQTQVARFWVESSPHAWNRIARTIATRKGLDLWENARLFGLLNMALADGYIATFDTKYKAYNCWRPVTAIQNADTDGNPRTQADPTWTPLVTTPPIPDYDSGHSVEGGAAAEVLRQFFGTDHVRFENCSYTLPPGRPAPMRRPSCGGMPPSPRPQARTVSHASSSGSTSGRRSRRGSSTARRSANGQSTASCSPCTRRSAVITPPVRHATPGRDGNWRPRQHRGLGGGEGASSRPLPRSRTRPPPAGGSRRDANAGRRARAAGQQKRAGHQRVRRRG